PLGAKPQPAASCPTTTSTSTSTSSTTSTSVACLSCCGSATRLSFTTTAPMIGSGTCDTSDGTVTGTVVDDTGANMCNLRAGGLYFGGAGVGVPLPSVIPDMTALLAKVVSCDVACAARPGRSQAGPAVRAGHRASGGRLPDAPRLPPRHERLHREPADPARAHHRDAEQDVRGPLRDAIHLLRLLRPAVLPVLPEPA